MARGNGTGRHWSTLMGTVAGTITRQEQTGFEVGEPGRHDEIISRQFQAQLLRLRHEQQILLGQGQHRDAGEIDLLRARQDQQHIEGPLEAIEGNHQRLVLPGSFLGGLPGIEINLRFGPFGAAVGALT